MATCKQCGIKYFSKTCPQCSDDNYLTKNNLKKNHVEDYISLIQLAKKISLSKNELEEILIQKKYIEKREKWIIATKIGKEKGIEERYNAISKIKYILLPKDFKIDMDVNRKIKKQFQQYNSFYKKEKVKTSYVEKVKKGKEYEAYIARFFRKQGYTVWEHGKEKGKEDSSIDLFIKKDDFVYFVQCKNWETWKINHKEVKATKEDIREYLKKNKEFWNLIKRYNIKILYVTPKECLTKGAYKYIKEHKDTIDYQVIPIIKE